MIYWRHEQRAGEGCLGPRADLAERAPGGRREAVDADESQDESVYRLTDEQVEEGRRRVADPNARRLFVAEVRERITRLALSKPEEAP